MPQGRDNLTAVDQRLVADRWVLAGICGAGMQSFCQMISAANPEKRLLLTGTDIAEDQFGQLTETHPNLRLESWNRTWGPLLTADTLVVHSVAVSPESPVLQAAGEVGCRILPLPIALGEFLRNNRQVCIAGTHGKTTTTGIVSWILRQAGREKTHYIGGDFLRDLKTRWTRSSSFSSGDWAVVESCEYRDSFLSLSPEVAVLTGIEHDHFDFFKTLSDQRASFESFVARCHSLGTLVVNHECPLAMRIANAASCRMVTYSVDDLCNGAQSSDWLLRPVADAARRTIDVTSTNSGVFGESGFRQPVELRHRQELVTKLTLQVPGRHNRQNVVAGIAAAVACGVPVEDAAKFAESFCGMKRRFEYRGQGNQVHWIDDYAHHPTAIAETLRAAQQCFPKARIIAVIEPHQMSRLSNLFENYVKSLVLADDVIVLPVLAARENASVAACQRASGLLVRAISESGGRALLAANLDQAIGRLDHAARPGDVVITMGAGRTHKIHDEIHRRLQRNSAA